MKLNCYEVTPATVALPLIPSLTSDTNASRLVANGMYSHDVQTSRLDSIGQETERRLNECKEHCRRGNYRDLLRLIEKNPAFMLNEWVAEKYFALTRTGYIERIRGRRFGSGRYHQLELLGLVEWMIRSGQVQNKERAFRYLHELGFCGYDTAKKVYYDAFNNWCIRCLLFEQRGRRREISSREYEDLLKGACFPK